MNDQAVVIRLFDLWDACEKEYKARYGDAINMEIVTLIFDRAHHEIISKEIEKRRQEVRAQQEKDYDEPPTEKQIQYARDLGCKNPESMTRKELSDWIDDHKGRERRGSYKWSR